MITIAEETTCGTGGSKLKIAGKSSLPEVGWGLTVRPGMEGRWGGWGRGSENDSTKGMRGIVSKEGGGGRGQKSRENERHPLYCGEKKRMLGARTPTSGQKKKSQVGLARDWEIRLKPSGVLVNQKRKRKYCGAWGGAKTQKIKR